MHAKNIQSPMFNDGQIHIAKWVRNALDLNDGDELLLIPSRFMRKIVCRLRQT